MTQHIYVLVRVSDGKYLRKHIKSFVDWRKVLTQGDERERARVEKYFTDNLGEARVFTSEAVACQNYPKWNIYLGAQRADGEVIGHNNVKIDWLDDGYIEVRRMEAQFA